jgi:hypothetical protein
MQPGQIISLMKYEGHPNTMSMSDHADHIHVGFEPRGTSASSATRQGFTVLKPGQWNRLVDRLDQIDNPVVRR